MLALRFLRGRSGRAALAAGALAIAVAGIAATDLVNRAVVRAFVAVIEHTAGPAALRVTAGDGALFPDRLAETVGHIPGVALVMPVLTTTAFTAEGAPEPLMIHGLDLADERTAHLYGASTALDRPLTVLHSDAIIVTRRFAARRHVRVGESVVVVTPGGPRRLVVRALLDPDGAARLYGDDLAVMHLPAAQAIFARPGLVSRIDVVLERQANLPRVAAAVKAALPAGLGATAPAEEALRVRRLIRSLQALLWTAAAIGVVLSFFVAFSHLASHFEGRAWDAAVLRALGVRTGAVWRELMNESVLLGAAGIALGIPLGIALARVLLPLVTTTVALDHSLPHPASTLGIRPGSLALAGSVGLVAALLAAGAPAWRAARVPVTEGLRGRGREQAVASPGAGVLARWAWLFATIAALALQTIARSPRWGIAATAVVVAGVALAVRPLLGLIGPPLAATLDRFGGPAGPLACAGILRRARRTTLLVATIAVGIGCVLWAHTIATSFEQTVADALRGTFGAPLVVSSARVGPGWIPAPLDEQVLDALAGVAGVTASAGNRILTWHYRDRAIALNAFDASYFTHPRFGRPQLVGEHTADVWDAVARGAGVIVSSNFALNFGMRVGDTLDLATPAGLLDLPIVGMTTAFVSAGGTVEMSRALLAREWRDHQVNRVWVRTAPGTDPDVVRAAVFAGPGRTFGLRVLTGSETLAYLVSQVHRAFVPLGVARAIVLLVVLLGMADMLAAGVVERTRELGMVRAVGAGPRHLRRMVLAEGLLVAALGLLLAGALGLTLGVVWTRSTFPYLLGWVLEAHEPARALRYE